MKTNVKLISPSQCRDWERGDTGVIDAYVQGSSNRPYAVVILDKNNKFVLVPIYAMLKF